jgi:hypothetical protein
MDVLWVAHHVNHCHFKALSIFIYIYYYCGCYHICEDLPVFQKFVLYNKKLYPVNGHSMSEMTLVLTGIREDVIHKFLAIISLKIVIYLFKSNFWNWPFHLLIWLYLFLICIHVHTIQWCKHGYNYNCEDNTIIWKIYFSIHCQCLATGEHFTKILMSS